MKPSNKTLEEMLQQTAAIKQEMAKLLLELETTATGKQPSRTGEWRHHPKDWAAENLPRDLT